MSFHIRDMVTKGMRAAFSNAEAAHRENGRSSRERRNLSFLFQSSLPTYQMKRFGHVKFAPKPKTEKDWTRIYNRHKYEIPTVKKLTLTLSSKGAGQTGARYVMLCTHHKCVMRTTYQHLLRMLFAGGYFFAISSSC